jgi:hypothetical protein
MFTATSHVSSSEAASTGAALAEIIVAAAAVDTADARLEADAAAQD